MGRKRRTATETDGSAPVGNVELPIPEPEEGSVSEFSDQKLLLNYQVSCWFQLAKQILN